MLARVLPPASLGLALGLALAVTACTMSSPSGVDVAAVCAVEQAALAANGTEAQGARLNGIGLNGINLNGVQLNGISRNGISRNGISRNGVMPNGIASNAGGWNGIELDDGSAELRLDGGVLVLQQGRAAETRDLAGATLRFTTSDGAAVDVVVARVHFDASDKRYARYELHVAGENVCAAGGDGAFVSGAWDARGAHVDDGEHVTFACVDGVISKCVDWGYRPWTAGADMHQTCTRLARADYCGDGVAHTENGTLIDIYDEAFVARAGDAGLTFEAGWSTGGAVCVGQTRYLDVTPAGDIVEPACLATLPACASFDEAFGEHGALIANDSAHTARCLR